MEGDRAYHGRLRCQGSRKLQLEMEGLEDPRWVRYQVEEMVAHREAPSVSRMASETGCSWGDDDGVYGRRIDFIGDRMLSFYRIKDRRITQIGRNYKSRKFIINIDSHQVCGGKFAAQSYVSFYWSREDHRLLKTEVYHDSYQQFGQLHLPVARRFNEATEAKLVCRNLKFENIELI